MLVVPFSFFLLLIERSVDVKATTAYGMLKASHAMADRS
jgi:hypothetical protein